MQGTLLTLAYAAYLRFLSPGAFSSRWGRGVVITLAVLWFALVAVPQTILALFIAPPLFALTLHALRRLSNISEESGALMALRPVPWTRYAAIFAMPLCANDRLCAVPFDGSPVSNQPMDLLCGDARGLCSLHGQLVAGLRPIAPCPLKNVFQVLPATVHLSAPLIPLTSSNAQKLHKVSSS